MGRIFRESALMEVGAERGWIKHSDYEAYLGGYKTFCGRFEEKLDGYRHLGKRLVFISDGAAWIRNWIEDAYPQATHILDWYHAVEHLGAFAEKCFTDPQQKQQWIAQQKDLLCNSRVECVLENIKVLPAASPEAKKGKQELLCYYRVNSCRMDDLSYRSMGAGIIGSGAIEAAHRSVIQKRLKLSGQRWSKKGAQNVITLRCTNLSGKWNKVVNLINQQTLAA